MPITEAPAPWKKLGFIPAGSLQALGFVDDSDDLLLVTFEGRELWHCPTMTRLVSDGDDSIPTWTDLIKLRCPGIGPSSDAIVRLAGLHGGGLPTMTVDSWSLQAIGVSIVEVFIILEGMGLSRKLEQTDGIHPFGFSNTGLTFIYSDGIGSIWVYGRNSDD